LREAATYLHDVLLQLQHQYAQTKGRKGKAVPLLVAANKMDLFTALPPKMVQAALEAEITRLRATRAKGIASVGKAGKGEGLESGAADEMNDDDDEGNVLGGDASGKFNFSVMREWGVDVSVVEGSVANPQGPGVYKWWDWIAELL
jgi:signal recognition particle receptor subunit beta